MRTNFENTVDWILAIIFTAPITLLLITTTFCSGWNEGTMAGTCVIPALAVLYNWLNGILLLAAFFGFIIGPLIFILIVISFVQKILRYGKGNYPRDRKGIGIDILTFAPTAIVLLVMIFTAIVVA